MPRQSTPRIMFSGVIARLDRAIQYSERAIVDREAAAYWIARLRGR